MRLRTIFGIVAPSKADITCHFLQGLVACEGRFCWTKIEIADVSGFCEERVSLLIHRSALIVENVSETWRLLKSLL